MKAKWHWKIMERMAALMNKETNKRRSALAIMGQLIGLVKPLMGIMAAAILLGTIGYLCAIFHVAVL